jgi:hypothetical protein
MNENQISKLLNVETQPPLIHNIRSAHSIEDLGTSHNRDRE